MASVPSSTSPNLAAGAVGPSSGHGSRTTSSAAAGPRTSSSLSSTGMSSPSPSPVHTASSPMPGPGFGEDVDWKDRCQSLESSLLRFKQQAARIRELLAEKMQDLEIRTQEAEKKAEKAEEKNKTLQQHLAAVTGGTQQPEDKLQQLEMEIHDKDRIIFNLRLDLNDQRQLRIQEAKLLEEKSSKIRDWVAKKIKDLEQQNQSYRSDSVKQQAKVETLRARLQMLPTSSAREVHRVSVQSGACTRPASDMSAEDFYPPIPKRPSSSILDSIRHECELELLSQDVDGADMSPELDDNMADHVEVDGIEPDYQEIDDNHESKYEPRKTAPPQVRIERKVFPNRNLNSVSIISSTAGSEEMLDRPCNGGLHGAGPHSSHSYGTSPPPHLTHGRRTPTSPGPTTSPNGDVMGGPRSQQHHTTRPPIAQFMPRVPFGSTSSSPTHSPPASTTTTAGATTPGTISPSTTSPSHHPMPGSPQPQEYPQFSPTHHGAATHTPSHSQCVSAYATMPRRRKDKLSSPVRGGKDRYEAQTLDRRLPARDIFERSLSERGRARLQPPTPPLRRLPSWENRIYAIANVGLKVPETGNPNNRDSSCPVAEGLYTEQMFKNLPVPVFATIKGRAAQIRSSPFSGDSSSDSSDNDEILDVAMTTDDEKAVSVAGPSGVKTTTGLLVRPQLNHTSSGATKRGVSTHSIASETSSDYAVPPDDDISIRSDSSDTSEPEQKLLKYTENFRMDSDEKCGYLTKLGGKVKNWKRRWFVLRNGDLLYYKSHNDVSRKPQGCVNIDGQTKIVKTESPLTFEITTADKMYYLSADNVDTMEQWIRVLQNTLKQHAADRVLGQGKAKTSMRGWLIKTKNGRNRRCWCVLMGKFFMYYRRPDDKTPLGQLLLREARIEEVDRSCDSESDSDDTSVPDYTLSIWPTNHGPTYLMLPTKHEKDSWLYHLTVASGGGCGKVGTEYEQIISKLMSVDGEPSSVYWKHPNLLHTKEPLTHPLTTLPSEELQHRALDLFKCVQLFMSIAMESNQFDQHVTLGQNVFNTCLQHPDLQNELYCQLIRQTSRHPAQHKSAMQSLLCGSSSWFLCDASPTSPTSSSEADMQDSKLNPSSYVILQGWQLMSMGISLFLPRQSALWYLKAHLQRHADPRTDVGKYAAFCQRAMERTLHNGGREARPSRMELLSILLRNPYHHSQPISIPVHFLNGSYQVVSFDGSTSVQEFMQSLNKALNMRDTALSGFSLFTDNPTGQELEHHLKGHIKLCDMIAKWEQEFLAYAASQKGHPDTSRTVRLTYKNRLYFKSLARTEAEKERVLLVYQVNEEIVNSRFPLNRDLAVELAALMAQIEFGDFRTPGEMTPASTLTRTGVDRTQPQHSQQQMPIVIDRFYPKRYRDLGPSDMRLLGHIIREKWIALRGRTAQDCVRIYLTVARKWQYFGAKLFCARIRQHSNGSNSGHQLWLAVQEEGVAILDYASLKPLRSYEYKNIVTFGGHREDLMLVINHRTETSGSQKEHRTDRLFFVLSKPKILEVTMLMASYINSRGKLKSQQTASCVSRVSAASGTSGGGGGAGGAGGEEARDNRSNTPSTGAGTVGGGGGGGALKLLPNKPTKPFVSTSVEV